ncbi:MAG: serine/threonine-protein phosphatase [Brevinematales bacterium]|nr:serine/threonine-protein phosphatase [Brevinematales bacterium]
MKVLFFLFLFGFSYSLDVNIEYSFAKEDSKLSELRFKNIDFIKLEIENKPYEHILFLRFKLPETNLTEYCIYYYSTEQFYEVYVDDISLPNKISEFHYGRLIPEKLSLTTGEKFNIIKLREDYKGKYIYFKIFYANEAMFLRHKQLKIIRLEDAYKSIVKDNIYGMIMSVIIVISGLFLMLISFLKYFEKKAFFGAGLFIFFLGLKQVSENLLTVFLLDFPFLWGYIAFFSSYLMMLGLFIFLDVILRKKFNSILNLLFYSQILIIILVCLIEIYGNVALSKLLNFYFIYLMGIIIVLFSFLLFSALESNREAQFLAIGGIFLFLSAMYEILARGFGIFFWSKVFLDIGVLTFIYSIIFILFYRFIRVYKEKEEYLRELNIKNNQFVLIKEQLEEILSQKNLELETAINRIKLNKNLVERELELAKKIQTFLIPSVPPLFEIEAFYKPMEQVCGDFYDFIEIDDDKIGIFISDVSGHGVPAALITSMIKSAINQMTSELTNPAKFLKKLNDFLYVQLQGHFVTAFYGIYNKNTRQFIYANAGHTLPYKISKEEISKLSSENRGIPLGIMKTDEATKIDKGYVNSTIKLQKKDKLFFFTDGLSESTPFEKFEKDDPIYFGEVHLDIILDSVKNFSPSDIIKIVYDKLIEFRGGDFFDDDICMICLEVE